ncbi:MAG: preprotein translocase subunit SecD [Massiliimalia sp.]|jgi:protein-export membrane protein SecD
MKRVPKPMFFVVVLVTVVFTVLSITGIHTSYGDVTNTIIKGVSEIRWGIDIRGGVDVTFTPPEGTEATNEQLDAAAQVMKQRMVSLNITDYEVYTDDASDRIIVRFPWKSDEEDFDAEAAIKELGDTAVLTFREGMETDEEGKPTGETADSIILEGKDVKQAKAVYVQMSENSEPEWTVQLKLNDSGKEAFFEATSRQAQKEGGCISIWMDDEMISAPGVSEAIDSDTCYISGSFDADSAEALANKINGGALPFKLETENYSTINPILGMGARDAMVLSGVIAFVLICIFMIVLYRLPGVVACIALMGQVGFMLAALTGFIPSLNSFTLTIPGIAGIILSIGIGVDANIITAERIKEEINNGKSIDGAIELGYKRAFTAIFDGNITNVVVAIILMGTFGPPDSIFAKIMSPLLMMFPASTEGAIYSFGYTLLIGVIANFLFGVLASKYMMKPVSRFKCFRNPKLYGGKTNA